MRITAEALRQLHACSQQVELFEKTFPGGTNVTLAACRKALKVGLQLHWLATLFKGDIQKAYDEATATAQKAYNEATATAQKAYNEATATALKAYNEAVAPARKAYNEATATAQKALDEAVARAFYSACKATAKR